MESGVYKIVNTKNNKVYIGSTNSFKRRKNNHFSQLRNNKHINKYLQMDFNKFGEDIFLFEIIKKCELDELIEQEQYYINIYESCNSKRGYNIEPNAGSSLGIKRSDETRNRISEVRKCKKMSEETKEKISKKLKGKKKNPFTEEHLKNLSESHKGLKLSEETRKKLSEIIKIIANKPENKERVSLQSRGENNNFAKLTEKEVIEIKSLLRTGKYTQIEISKLFNVRNTTINAIKMGKTWKHIA